MKVRAERSVVFFLVFLLILQAEICQKKKLKENVIDLSALAPFESLCFNVSR